MPHKSNAKAILEYSFLHVFAKENTIDAAELAMLERLALEDGEVDAEERQILSRIFSRVTADTVTPEVWQEIGHFKARYDII